MSSVISGIGAFMKLQCSYHTIQVAFLMGRHHRLGAESPVRLLPKDLIRFILALLKARVIVVGGLVNKSELAHPNREVHTFQPYYDDPVSTHVCTLLHSQGCAKLPNLPIALAFECGACDESRIFVAGGCERFSTGRQLTGADGPWEGRPNLDVFVFSRKKWTWSKMTSLLRKPCIRGASVVFGSKLIILGGYHGSGVTTPDRAFNISGDPRRIHFPQRVNLQTDCWYVESSCVVIGSYLVAFCGFFGRHHRRGRVDVLDLTDNFANWLMMPEFNLDLGISRSGFGVFEGKLFVIGGMKGVSFGCAVDTVWIADMKESLPRWKEGPSLPVPLFGCSVVSAKDGLYCVGGSTGHECSGFERSRIVFCYNGKNWKISYQLPEGIDSCGAFEAPKNF
jgi:hypothetical protein